tara:strand:- start:56 stop:265 length:210 start_codon:yes stop_codon:yes gene_type:complete
MNRLEMMRVKAQLGTEITKTEMLQMFGELNDRIERLENLYAEMAQSGRGTSKKTRKSVSPDGVSGGDDK